MRKLIGVIGITLILLYAFPLDASAACNGKVKRASHAVGRAGKAVGRASKAVGKAFERAFHKFLDL